MTTATSFTPEEWAVIHRYLGMTDAGCAIQADEMVRCDCGALLTLHALSSHKRSNLHANRLEWGSSYKERLDTTFTCECGGKTTYRQTKRHAATIRHQKFLKTSKPQT
jgi:hypothetical protein